MTLIDAYIEEVSKRLHKNRRENIKLELKATIEDMLPEPYSEADIMKVLKELGSPAKVAASYQDTPRFLIGPNVFDPYTRTIKLVFPWAIFITVIVQVIERIFLYSGEEAMLSTIISTFAMTIVTIISVSFHVLFWITVFFIVLERSDPSKIQLLPFLNDTKEWTPESLKIKTVPKEKIITLSDTIFSFLGAIIFTFVYWNANRLLGIYTTNGNGSLKFVMPILNQNLLQSYALIVMLCIILSLALTFLKWRTGQWTMTIAIINALLQSVGTIVFIVIAVHQDFIHSASIPYIAAIVETNKENVSSVIDKILLASMIIAVLANAFDIYQGFRKAKIPISKSDKL
ncbi:HAAS signaling domain-containing protein [Lysinibacillus sphaericus]|uniref:HAAS signaling domain-containing protein n=1 Tax=Lysinibacillus sphaericus TaxID=1421 RepID=UPI000C197071|nr:hypothetical protein [Lysinibacillus sphaericus]PIJ98395.1 hypothetical protein CTN02_09050 [Lysinibacillus sphaericus]QTB27073.1 hypothetical protein J2D51_23355 [Lysinibacillus sphaericus]